MPQKFLWIFISILFLIIFTTSSAKAQSPCATNLDNCEFFDFDPISYPDLKCTGKRSFYDCSGTTCYQDSNSCNQVAICNADNINGKFDDYNCIDFCQGLADPSKKNCGDFKLTNPNDERVKCSEYISTCLTKYCTAASGGINYSCPAGNECIRSGVKKHQCITAVAVPTPAPPVPPPVSCSCSLENDVTCNQTVSSYSNCPTCPGTGTKCLPPTNICTVDGCKPPNPDSLCPVGEVLNDKFLYSCVPGNSGSSCPVGSQSSVRTCSAGKQCCYSLLVGPPKPKDEGWCSVFSAVSTGTNSATAEGDRYGFNRMDWYLSKNGATPIFHHTSNVAQTKASIEQFIDHSTTFNNLSPKTKYTVTAKGWCQTPECTRFSRDCLGAVSFTTDIPKPEGGKGGAGPGPHPNLQCWGGYQLEFGQVARWVLGTGTGVKYTANFNLPGTSGYKPGEGCFRPGVSVSDPGPEDGTLGGRIYVVDSCTSIDSLVKNTAKLTQPADFGNILYWVWSTADNGGPMCMLNNGTYCQLQDNSLNYVSSSNRLLGTIFGNDASPLYSGNSVSLISWDSTRFKPLGYYRYQHSVGKNCFEGPNGTECTQHACEPIPNNTSGTGSSSTGTGGREFFHWGGWLCDGCTGSPGWPSKPLVNNFYPNPDAPYCLSNDPAPANAIDNINPNARIDFIFERTGNSFTVAGYVYQDTNKNGTQDGGETTGIPDVTINLSGNSSGTTSPQTIQTNSSGHYSFTNVPSGNYSLSALTPEGYKLTTPESKDIIVGCDGLPSQNFLTRTSYYISGYVKNDVNFDGECSQDEPSFAGTVTLTNNIANRQPILLSGNGDYIFDDLPIPNILSPNKTYTYKVTADIGITPTSGLPYQEILTLPPSKKDVNFCIQVSSPWVQTDGDVHSNTGINMPKGPKPKPTP